MKLTRGCVVLVFWIVSVSGSRTCPENCKGMKNSTLPSCNMDTGECSTGCVSGYYGYTCNMPCDIHCGGKCQQHDGSCKCSLGYTFNAGVCESHTGVKCQKNDNCLKDRCLTAGREDCLRGCKPGWFGKFCENTCFSNCFCQQESGTCTSCEEGWYGPECETRCSQECLNKKCDRTGTCVDGCSTGMYGEECELNCSRHCVSRCDQLSGDCVQCVAGRYGSTCQSECSVGCAGTNRDCDRDGRCFRGCSKAYYGEGCELKCSPHCVSGCDQLTGDCVQCVAGRFGSTCQSECSVGCANGACDIEGRCNRRCERGFYGSFCNFTCENCKYGDCDMDTGECTHNGIQYWVGGGVAVVIIIIAAVFGYMSYRFKRMRGFVYNTVKRRRPPQGGQDVSTAVAPANIVEDEVTLTPPTVCPINTVRPSSYIHPKHSGGSTTNLQIQPDRPDSYCLPHYIELNENLMATPPRQPQETVAHAPVVSNSSSSTVADVHVQLRSSNKENKTGGEINIPLIAECFGNTETEDLTLNAEPPPEAANYDHLFKDQRQY